MVHVIIVVIIEEMLHFNLGKRFSLNKKLPIFRFELVSRVTRNHRENKRYLPSIQGGRVGVTEKVAESNRILSSIKVKGACRMKRSFELKEK
jgi:hypothetical protein